MYRGLRKIFSPGGAVLMLCICDWDSDDKEEEEECRYYDLTSAVHSLMSRPSRL